ncbi:DEAD/DEAH box helicase family protein, partial [Selenomonas sp.]|uniref:DEAD/DEAH box helicase family protein n=1 Tax=Selenomonas sp. TaxID=2053611 RepID=UPI002A756C79
MGMKLQFDAALDYQQAAIASVVGLFDGQQRKTNVFTVAPQLAMTRVDETPQGIGNRLELSEADVLENLRRVQMRNGLAPAEQLTYGMDFDIEMETGTGKTYVYLRSLLELHKVYGFTKFIIVVPNLAIKEGVWKSIEITRDHFANLYDHLPYDAFVYDSAKLNEVRSFATSDTVQIMVINIDAFRRSFTDPEAENKANIIHRANDRLNGRKPIELIAGTNPIVIIYEPQSVDTTPKSKEAIASLSPLTIFRYSATHIEHHHLIYKLDAKDSYELQLVKQIEVQSFQTKDANNTAYLRLVSVDYKKHAARVEMDVRGKSGVSRKIVTVHPGDDLYEKSKGRDLYEGFLVNDIDGTPGAEYIDFTGNPAVLRLGEALGAIDDRTLKRNQILETIRSHLDKELQLLPMGIKVLSLFFIDKVANYRVYDENGAPQPGPYAKMFESCYRDLIQHEKYRKLRVRFHGEERLDNIRDVHNGYFSIDKKGHAKDTSGKTQGDGDAYNLIMKDKERLLSMETPLRFIFSHSALREGWDNPNVFQICTLNETTSTVKKRQEIGRGLRLCVDQNGVRHHGFEINTLTVMANESYDEFADRLQKEYEEDGIRFGVLEPHDFAAIPVMQEDGTTQPLGVAESKAIYAAMQQSGYIDKHGVIQDTMRTALAEHRLQLPLTAEPQRAAIEHIAKKAAGKLAVRKKENRQTLHLRKGVLLSPAFKELWERIKWKTTYHVAFDSKRLVDEIARRIADELTVPAPKLMLSTALLSVSEASIEATETGYVNRGRIQSAAPLPDIVTYLQNETNLTRKSIVDALIASRRLHLFRKNPQVFMDGVAKIMRDVMQGMIVDGIKYTKIGDQSYYKQEL